MKLPLPAPSTSNLLVRWLDWLCNHLTGIVEIGMVPTVIGTNSLDSLLLLLYSVDPFVSLCSWNPTLGL
jgi:hypothetical protein